MPSGNRKGLLGQIRNPLVFFALALIIIEGIIGIVASKSQMTGQYQFFTILLMAFLFLCVVASVVLITIRWPKHLYEQIAESIDTVNEMQDFINSEGFADVVKDITCSSCDYYSNQNKEEL